MVEVTRPPEQVTAFVDAINDANMDAFVALFTPDGIVNDWGTEYIGHDRVRRWAHTDAIGAGARMRILSAVTEGSTTTIRFEWRSRVFNGESTGVFLIENDLIRGFTIPPER